VSLETKADFRRYVEGGRKANFELEAEREAQKPVRLHTMPGNHFWRPVAVGGVAAIIAAAIAVFLATSGDSESTTEGATVELIDDETDGDGSAADTAAGDTTASADSEEPAAAADSTDDDGTADGEGVSEWSSDDPTGDWQQWDTFDTIDRTRERNGVSAADFQDAADLVGVSVSATADATR
jgi:hypothetical protein